MRDNIYHRYLKLPFDITKPACVTRLYYEFVTLYIGDVEVV